jgi:hypothetical protein
MSVSGNYEGSSLPIVAGLFTEGGEQGNVEPLTGNVHHHFF